MAGILALIPLQPALAQSQSDDTGQIATDMDDKLAQCRQAPTTEMDPDTLIQMSFDIGETGRLDGIPAIEVLRGDEDDDALYQMTFDALLKCLPFESDGMVRTGSAKLRATPTEIWFVQDDTTLREPAEIAEWKPSKPIAALAPRPFPERSTTSTSTNQAFGTGRFDEEGLGLNRDRRREIQRRLTLLGYNTRGTDGVWGPNTRSAISDWQSANGYAASGYVNAAQLDRITSLSAAAYSEFQAEEAERAARARARARERERERARSTPRSNAPTPQRRAQQRVRVCKQGAFGILYDCRYEWR